MSTREPTVSFRLTADPIGGVRFPGAQTNSGVPSSAAPKHVVTKRIRLVAVIVAVGLVCVWLSTAGVPTVPELIVHPGNIPEDTTYLDYHTCMDKQNIPLVPDVSIASGVIGFSPRSPYRLAVFKSPYGGIMMSLNNPSAVTTPLSDDNLFSSIFESYPDKTAFNNNLNTLTSAVLAVYTTPALIVDGVDYSEQYIQCLDESGYSAALAQYEVEYHNIPVTDPGDVWLAQPQAYAQYQVTSNNQWARCARENGWMVRDSQISSTDDETLPSVALPSSITPDQLQALLEKCPSFDAAKQKEEDDLNQSLPQGARPDPASAYYSPNIVFASEHLPTAPFSYITPATQRITLLAKYYGLFTILDAQRNAYYSQSSR